MSTAPGPPPAEMPAARAAAPLPREFFGRPAVEVAPDLLGRVLVHDSAEGPVAAVIVETEAYAGQADPASHAYRGQTARNAVMFGPPGHAYVYFTYGMHFCVNLVCQPEGDASAVLLRAGRVIEGAALATARRTAPRRPGGAPRPVPAARELARGPGSFCQALGIERSMDGTDICVPSSPLRILAGSVSSTEAGAAGSEMAAAGAQTAADAEGGTAAVIATGPRVGVSRAAEVAWRFWLAGEPSVSAYRSYPARRARAKPVSRQARGGGTMPR
ncbi:MAG: DNA-3-methyladenine glycosylase [Streptosporangiaceae bacterium]